MQIWDKHSIQNILKSMEMELAKSKSELKCLLSDADKINNRIAFTLTAIHHLKSRLDEDI